ncbi:MAG: hypothetical protein ACE5FT_04995 [Candidatus Nanoarchaeia archaeon]
MDELNRLLGNFGYEPVNESEISRIPITTRKDILQFKYEQCKQKPLWIVNTSGSMGYPTLLYMSKEAHNKQIMRARKMLDIVGITNNDIMANVLDNPFVNFATIDGDIPYLDCGLFTPASRDLILYKMKTIKPTVLVALTTMAFDLLESLQRNDIFNKLVLVGSLTTPSYKARLKELSGADIHMLYGCTEVGVIAAQRSEDDEWYEIIDEGLYLEVLHDDGSTARTGTGRLLITDLYNYSMPLIRYDVGDKVAVRDEGGVRQLRVLCRLGDHVKVSGDLAAEKNIVEAVMNILGHDDFIVEILHNQATLKDSMSVYLPERDMGKKESLISSLAAQYHIHVIVSQLNSPVPRTESGKRKNIVDKRFT